MNGWMGGWMGGLDGPPNHIPNHIQPQATEGSHCPAERLDRTKPHLGLATENTLPARLVFTNAPRHRSLRTVDEIFPHTKEVERRVNKPV